MLRQPRIAQKAFQFFSSEIAISHDSVALVKILVQPLYGISVMELVKRVKGVHMGFSSEVYFSLNALHIKESLI